jgi:5-methylcytosine-specific restriction endonuclease McrA
VQHIEGKLSAGMSWRNRGAWHLDHIIPLASATTCEGLEKLCHYSNIQPLWGADNLRKGDRMPHELPA